MTSSDMSERWGPRSPKVAIMQPYFFPYIGYFQLMREVDVFVVYDNIKYTKKGWINRNRFLRNDEAAIFSLPLKHAPDRLGIVERELASEFSPRELLAQIEGAYRCAPYFESTFPVVQDIVRAPKRNLFEYLFNSICRIKEHLEITTSLVISSTIDANHSLHGQDRVLTICRTLRVKTYVNPTGGRALYAATVFRDSGMELAFLEPRLLPYDQFGGDFVPALSILDVLMFNSLERIRSDLLPAYEIAQATG